MTPNLWPIAGRDTRMRPEDSELTGRREEQEGAMETHDRRGNLIERSDWKVFAGLSVIVALFGAGDILMGGSTYAGGEAVLFSGITGTTWDELRAADPAAARLIDSMVRSAGAHLLFIGLLSLAVSLFGLRRGQRWAWVTMWLWPLYLVLGVTTLALTEKVPGAGIPVPMISGTIFLIITVGTLALSARKYSATSQAGRADRT
jgi:hypothetical protein